MTDWTSELPTAPGLYEHRNPDSWLQSAPVTMFVGYVNWGEDPILGHGTKPKPLGAQKLRACLAVHSLTADSLTVAEWGGLWRPVSVVLVELYTNLKPVEAASCR